MANRTPVYVLQHPHERRHPLGTVRLARLGLTTLNWHVHWNPGCGPSPLERELPAGTALLYPGADAVDLRDSVARGDAPQALLVLDGTWSQAHSLYRANPWLQQLPHVALQPSAPSRYRLRAEPGPNCVSTLEAIVVALQIIEPATPGLADLLASFEAFIASHVRERQRHPYQPRRRTPRRRAPHPVPAALADAEHLVVAYGETVPTADADSAGRRTMVHWVAQRLGDGALFAALLQPRPPARVAAQHLVHMGLSPADLEQGLAPSAFVAAWQAFLRATDRLCAWNQSSLDALASLGVRSSIAPLLLKSAYCNLRRRGCGHLSDVLAREEIPWKPIVGCRGRAAERLGQACAMAEVLGHTACRTAR